MFCNNCGREIVNNAATCPICGAIVNCQNMQQSANVQTANGNAGIHSPIKKKMNKLCMTGFILPFVLYVIFRLAAKLYVSWMTTVIPPNNIVFLHGNWGVVAAAFGIIFIGYIVGLIFSIVGIAKAKKKNERGVGLGVAGILLNSLVIIITVVVLLGIYFVGIMASN